MVVWFEVFSSEGCLNCGCVLLSFFAVDFEDCDKYYEWFEGCYLL